MILEQGEIFTYDVHMSDSEFEWVSKKDKANAKKHVVSFSEAKTAFFDETAMVIHDP